MYDAIIIGAGPAGLSAALWCDDLHLRALLIERQAESGGQLLWIHNTVANHLGILRAANGRDVRDLFAEQIAARKITARLEAEVAHLDAQTRSITLAGGETLRARSIIVATGLRRRELDVPGEAEFRGRGVSASGTRDRSLLAGREVCVVGGGDAAIENALLLAEVCPRVWLVHRGNELRARPEFVERLTAESRITTLLGTTIARIFGSMRVEGVELQRGGNYERLAVEAVLVRIGYAPNTELLRGQVEMDDGGYVRVTHEGETSVPDVFAIGDISNPRAPTISGAVGAGATVAKVIEARSRRERPIFQ